jgi:hypothetical protein
MCQLSTEAETRPGVSALEDGNSGLVYYRPGGTVGFLAGPGAPRDRSRSCPPPLEAELVGRGSGR